MQVRERPCRVCDPRQGLNVCVSVGGEGSAERTAATAAGAQVAPLGEA